MAETGGPSWLTGWIKLNNKHAVPLSGDRKPDEQEEKCQQTATTSRSPSTEISSKSAVRRIWSRKTTKENAVIIDESSDDDVLLLLHNRSVNDYQKLSHQILSEAAFMTEASDAPDEQVLYPADAPRSSPEGLIVTTIADKPRPPHINEPKNKSNCHHLNRFAAIFAGERSEPCQSCIALEKKLEKVYDDLEYMRGVALQQASSTHSHHQHQGNACGCGSGAYLLPVASKPSATAANELQELVKRHKQVVEALMSEGTRYQNNMELELEHREIVCQDLSKEVAVRKQETIVLQEQLDATRWERDELAIENLRLKAQGSFYAKQQAEYSELKRRYLDYEERGIQGAVSAIESRDKVIGDLATKLARALDQLELEREQQRQRRQIIFPLPPTVAAAKKS